MVATRNLEQGISFDDRCDRTCVHFVTVVIQPHDRAAKVAPFYEHSGYDGGIDQAKSVSVVEAGGELGGRAHA